MCRAKIAEDILLGIAAFLRADDHDLMRADGGKPSDNRAVFGIETVSVQFIEIREGALQIIERERALGMARYLDTVPGAQVRKNLPAGLFDLLFDLGNFFLEADSERVRFRMFF